MNNLYPIFMKIENMPCLVIGGGTVAMQKIRQLLDADANVTVISSKASAVIKESASMGKITFKERVFMKGDCRGYFLVIGATDDHRVNKQVYDDSRNENIPVNIVDTPELCTFYLGSVHKEGDLKIAVSTNGKSPTLGKIIRDSIKSQFGPEFAGLLVKLGNERQKILETGESFEKRKMMFERIVRKELLYLKKI